ncbi:MAG: hybrid sensor histidine kinase/response regulator [Oligoflexia bacterium]|nr:hybrid sensor histidine kinase/response regulator [Oligoflexia bacterium]
MTDNENLKRILVIDDQKSIHEDFKTIFGEVSESDKELDLMAQQILGAGSKKNSTEIFKYVVDSAFQGQEGYQKILDAKKSGNPYHMAFVDMRMPPGWDGLETIEKVLKDDNDIQMVICTAYSDHSVSDIEARIGITDRVLIIKKPFDKVEIIQLAKSLCEKWFLLQKARMKVEEMETIIQQRSKEIEEIQKQLYRSSKMAAMGTLAGGVAHELNNPMAILLGYVGEVEKNVKTLPINENNSLKKAIEGIRVSAKRMYIVVKELLTFVGENQKEDFIDFKVCDFLDATISVFSKTTLDKDINVIKEYTNSEKLIIKGDNLQLQEMILHLLNNAKDAIAQTPIKTILIKTLTTDKNVQIIIEDSGTPINEDIRERIFEPYFTTKSVGKGKGIGLSVARNIARSHSGDLSLDLVDGKKSFIVSLPLTL